MTADRTSLYLIILKDSLRIYRTPRSKMAINMMFPNNASPRTSLQFKIVDNVLLEEFLSAVLAFETDILKASRIICTRMDWYSMPCKQNHNLAHKKKQARFTKRISS